MLSELYQFEIYCSLTALLTPFGADVGSFCDPSAASSYNTDLVFSRKRQLLFFFARRGNGGGEFFQSGQNLIKLEYTWNIRDGVREHCPVAGSSPGRRTKMWRTLVSCKTRDLKNLIQHL